MSSNATRHGPLFLFTFILLFLAFSPSQASGSSLIPIGLRLLPVAIISLTWFCLYADVAKARASFVFSLFLTSAYVIAINLYDFSFLVVIFVVMVWSASLIIILINNSLRLRAIFLDACTWVLVVWIVSLSIQAVGFLVMGAHLQLHSIIFPYSHARVHLGENYARFAGTQVEPGTYTNWVYGVVFLRSLMLKKISSRLHITAIFSTLLTLSAWAYFAVPFFLLAIFIEGRSLTQFAKRFFSIAALIMLFSMLFYQKVSAYLESRFLGSGGTQSLSQKNDVYSFMVSHFPDWIYHGITLNTMPCSFCESPQGAGVGVNFLMYFGILGIIFLIYLIYRLYRRLGFHGLLFIFPLFLAKYYVFDPVTCLIALMIIYYDDSRIGHHGCDNKKLGGAQSHHGNTSPHDGSAEAIR